MDKFDANELNFHLPDSYKGMKKDYILSRMFNLGIQKRWIPGVGDVMVGETGNIFVISGIHHLKEELGGPLYFFGGGLCNRDGGCLLNSTQSYVMNKEGKKYTELDVHHISKVSDFRYVPYPHE